MGSSPRFSHLAWSAPKPSVTQVRKLATRQVHGHLFEVLPDFGLAHFEADDGCVYGVNRTTPGIVFDDLREGQLIRCTVTTAPTRVLTASVVG